MTEESELTVRGPGPFHLPAAQRATASGNKDNGVTMTFWAVLRNSPPESVQVQLTSKLARELAVQLLQAADASEDK
jgi:hypothetical protein